MTSRGYTVLGWVVYQFGVRAVRRKVAQNRVKLGAVATIALVLVAGVAAAKASGDDS